MIDTYFDILKCRLGVDHKCDRRTDRQTERPLAIARSNIFRRALKLRDNARARMFLSIISNDVICNEKIISQTMCVVRKFPRTS